MLELLGDAAKREYSRWFLNEDDRNITAGATPVEHLCDSQQRAVYLVIV